MPSRLRVLVVMIIHIQALAASSQALGVLTAEDTWGAVRNDLLEAAEVDPIRQSFVVKSVNYNHAFSRYSLNDALPTVRFLSLLSSIPTRVYQRNQEKLQDKGTHSKTYCP